MLRAFNLFVDFTNHISNSLIAELKVLAEIKVYLSD